MPEPNQQPPRRKPLRCVMMHPYVEEATQLRVAASAVALGTHPDRLAGYILDRVFDDVHLQRLLKI